MLVPPDLVKLDRDDSDDKKGDKATQKKDKYCRTYKCKHAPGKHTEEGNTRYKERKQKTEETGEQGRDTSRNRTRSTRNPKGICYTCCEVHFPFRAPPKKGNNSKCFGCGKQHGPPFFPRKGKTDVKDRKKAEVREAQSLESKLSQAVKKAIKDKSLFMMIEAGGRSDICRANIKLFVEAGTIKTVTVCNDTGSNVTVARPHLLHDISECPPGVIGGFGGNGLLKRRDYLVKAHPSKHG